MSPGLGPGYGWAYMGPRDVWAQARGRFLAWMGHEWALVWMAPMGPQDGWALGRDGSSACMGPEYVWTSMGPRDGWALGRNGPSALMGSGHY